MGKKMTTGEIRGLTAAAIVMAIGVLAVAWSSGRFSESKSDDAGAIEVSTSDSLVSDSVVTVTIGKRLDKRNGKRHKVKKRSERKTYVRRSPLDEPVNVE